MKSKNIIVTGGAGFIGSHTVIELHRSGYRPIIVDNFSNSEHFIIDRINELCGEKITFYECDCTNEKELEEVFANETPIGVIHFAAYKSVSESIEHPLKYYHNNIGSLVVLLKLIKKYEVNQLVFSSSCTVYGEPQLIPVTENTELGDVKSPYGYTKIVGEQIIKDFCRSSDRTSSIILRYFNPIGAHSSGRIGELPRGIPSNLIPYITQTGIGTRDSLIVHGNDYPTTDGTCIRDYIHVVDLANAHVASLKWLEKENNSVVEVFNIGTGKGNSVMDVIKAFESISGILLNYKIDKRRTGDIIQIWASTDKAEKLLGWKPIFSLEDCLRDAWNWQINL